MIDFREDTPDAAITPLSIDTFHIDFHISCCFHFQPLSFHCSAFAIAATATQADELLMLRFSLYC